MSYNIDHSEYLSGKLYIKRRNAQILLEKYCDRLAEGNFLHELDLSVKLDPEEMLEIKEPWWYGCGADYDFDYPKDTLVTILKKTKGKAVIVFTWEGGDSTTALQVKDGVVTEKKVKISVE